MRNSITTTNLTRKGANRIQFSVLDNKSMCFRNCSHLPRIQLYSSLLLTFSPTLPGGPNWTGLPMGLNYLRTRECTMVHLWFFGMLHRGIWSQTCSRGKNPLTTGPLAGWLYIAIFLFTTIWNKTNKRPENGENYIYFITNTANQNQKKN